MWVPIFSAIQNSSWLVLNERKVSAEYIFHGDGSIDTVYVLIDLQSYSSLVTFIEKMTLGLWFSFIDRLTLRNIEQAPFSLPLLEEGR
jgi:hypothetical protein